MLNVQTIFRRKWSHFWATTYSFDLGVFEDYLHWNLGETCSTTVLADAHRLDRQWRHLQQLQETSFLERVNRKYLLASVPWPRTFHPKTYCFVAEDEARLLVGSGNLSLDGLLTGYEQFVEFDAGNAVGRASIAAWQVWMAGLVRQLNDEQASTRWRRLEMMLGPLVRETDRATSLFVTNQRAALLEQLMAAIGGRPIEHLMVSAPFFDKDCHGLDRLLEVCRSARTSIYLGSNPSVDGPRLLEVLTSRAPDAQIFDFGADDFVHTKLIGVLFDSGGLLLSGSANLSGAALLEPARSGNVEAGTLTEASSDLVQAAFEHPDFNLRPLDPVQLTALAFRSRPEEIPQVRLVRAVWTSDDRVVVTHSPSAASLRLRAVLGELAEEVALSSSSEETRLGVAYPRSITAAPPSFGRRGLLVQLVDSEGTQLSNFVAVEDPLALETSSRVPGKRPVPPELRVGDLDTPIGHLLELLRNACDFDYLHEAGLRARREREQEEEGFIDPEGDITLGADAYRDRTGRFDRWLGRDPDELFEQLHAMLQQVPLPHMLRPLYSDGGRARGEGGGQKWAPEHRLGVRVRNLLKRWAGAIGQPAGWDQLELVAKNYLGLVRGLHVAMEEDELRLLVGSDGLADITSLLIDGIQRFLHWLPPERRERVFQALADYAALEGTCQLVGGQLRDDDPNWRDRALEWKEMLQCATEAGLLRTDDRELAALLASRTAYMEPAYWLDREGTRFDLKLKFEHQIYNIIYDAQLDIEGGDLIRSTKVPRLLLELERYLHPKTVALTATARRQAVFLFLDEPAVYRSADQPSPVTSHLPFSLAVLGELIERGQPLGEIFPRTQHDAEAAGVVSGSD